MNLKSSRCDFSEPRCKVTASFGSFQIFVRNLLRLVATEWERCDKPPPSPKILSQAK